MATGKHFRGGSGIENYYILLLILSLLRGSKRQYNFLKFACSVVFLVVYVGESEKIENFAYTYASLAQYSIRFPYVFLHVFYTFSRRILYVFYAFSIRLLYVFYTFSIRFLHVFYTYLHGISTYSLRMLSDLLHDRKESPRVFSWQIYLRRETLHVRRFISVLQAFYKRSIVVLQAFIGVLQAFYRRFIGVL